MANINVDGNHYDLDQLSAEAKAKVASLQFVDNELQRLNAQIAVFQTARMGYLTALKKELATLSPAAAKLQ